MKVAQAVDFWLEYHKANSQKNTVRVYEELIFKFSIWMLPAQFILRFSLWLS